jgi:hypothetical protein
MGNLYIDSSAAGKLLRQEPESAALEHFLHDRRRLFASRLLEVELGRLRLRHAALVPEEQLVRVLASVNLVALKPAILTRAGALRPAELRALDAIHLATALFLPDLQEMVVYDRRLSAAAEAMGLRVWAPA